MNDEKVELARLKKERRALAKKLSDSAESVIKHVENGSFEIVESALMGCREAICEVQNQMQEQRTKRRARKNTSIAQASPA